MGGISPEHDVSLHSGLGMYNQLDNTKFDKFPILISKQNNWYWPRNSSIQASYQLSELQEAIRNVSPHWQQARFPHFSKFPSADIFLLGLHGIGGEDGTLQGFLKLANQPYTGSHCKASALAMDKITTKILYQSAGIQTPSYVCIHPTDNIRSLAEKCAQKLGFPCVLKDPVGGSSLGVSIAKNAEIFQNLMQSEFHACPVVLAEEYLTGREASCGFIQNFEALPPTEIIPQKDAFFNYEAKYQSDRTKEITPAEFSPDITETIQNLAEKCHSVLGLSVYSRSDFILTEKGIYVLETNTLPGFTDASILPQEAAAAGLTYTGLLTKIIEESLS